MIKKFDQFTSQDKQDEIEKEPYNIPDEFTGDIEKDDYLRSTIFHSTLGDRKYFNTDYKNDTDTFSPIQKAQKEGNKYNEIWKSLVNWIISSDKFVELSVWEKDKILISSFNDVVSKQKGLITAKDYEHSIWNKEMRIKCQDKWISLTKLAKKVYPNDEQKRKNLVRDKFIEYIQKEDIEKYARKLIPEFSKSFG